MPEPDPAPESAPEQPAGTDVATPAEPAEPEPATKPAEPEPAAEPAEAEPAKPAEPTGTEPPWWPWVRRHRKPVTLVAGLVVVALVGTLVLVSVLTPGPNDVVQEYLDAIQAGDTDTALELAGEPDAEDRLPFLTTEAMADDWTVEAVVERHQSEEDAEVDVTIRAGDTTEQGRFRLSRKDDDWTMESPFVRIDLTVGDLDVIELGDQRREVTELAPAYEQAGVVPLLLFPGVYELYPGHADRFTLDPGVLVAAPQESPDEVWRLEPVRTLTDNGVEAAQRAIDAHVDTCAESTDVSPNGCPFDAENSDAVRGLAGLTGVNWTILTRPRAHVVTGAGTLEVVVRTPGTVRLTGSGIPEYPEDRPRTTFTTTCEFGLAAVGLTMTSDGFTATGTADDAYRAATTTLCY